MPSSYSTSLRFELQFTGDNDNLWGYKHNAALSRADDAIAGFATIALTGNLSLSTANGGADQARLAMLKFTGAGAFTVTVPATSKRYDVWNACSGVLTVSNGSASVTVQPGEVAAVITDGGAAFKRVVPNDFAGAILTSVGQVALQADPTSALQAATKQYVDTLVSSTSFAMAAGQLPAQSVNAGRYLTTNGAVASWALVTAAADYVSDQATRTGAGQAQAIAFAVSL